MLDSHTEHRTAITVLEPCNTGRLYMYVSVTGRLYMYRRIRIIRPWAMHPCYVYFTTFARNRSKSVLKGGWAYITSWAYNTYSTVCVSHCLYMCGSAGGADKSMEAYALLVSATLHKAIKPYSSAYWLHAHAQTETYMYMYTCTCA